MGQSEVEAAVSSVSVMPSRSNTIGDVMGLQSFVGKSWVSHCEHCRYLGHLTLPLCSGPGAIQRSTGAFQT